MITPLSQASDWLHVLESAVTNLEHLGCRISNIYASTSSVPKIILHDGSPLWRHHPECRFDGRLQLGECVVIWPVPTETILDRALRLAIAAERIPLAA